MHFAMQNGRMLCIVWWNVASHLQFKHNEASSCLPLNQYCLWAAFSSDKSESGRPRPQTMVNKVTDTNVCVSPLTDNIPPGLSCSNWSRQCRLCPDDKCLFTWQQRLKHRALLAVRWWEFSSWAQRNSRVYVEGRRHVTSHVSGNDREAGSLSPFTGQSDRPRTESCVKRYMEILFMVPWHKAENAWLVGLTALQLEWVTEHRKHKAESLNANLVHSLGFKMTWQSWQQQNYDTTHRQ